LIDTSRYEAYGEEINGTGSVANKYLFAGEQYDQNLGDYYLRARYYDTDSGRFTRRDVYEGSLSNPLTLHKYIYANANPVNFTDPTGFITFKEGREVHQAIGEDFEESNPDYRHADLQGEGNGLTILRILRDADGLPDGNPPWNGLRPDLADYGTREIYEIKPLHRLHFGLAEVWGYQAILNSAPFQHKHWNLGSTYDPSGAYVIGHKIAIAFTPINGVIPYQLFNNPTDELNNLNLTLIYVNTLLLISLIAIASAQGRYGAA